MLQMNENRMTCFQVLPLEAAFAAVFVAFHPSWQTPQEVLSVRRAS